VDVELDHRLDEYLQFDGDIAAKDARIIGIGENNPRLRFTNDGVAWSKQLTYQVMSRFNTPNVTVPIR
jgi:hypothetical protein